MKKVILILTIIIVLSPYAFAARPMNTEDTGIVEVKNVEIETGFSYLNTRTTSNIGTMGVQIKTGLFKKFDVSLEIPCQISKSGGLMDLIIHSKCRLFGTEENGFAVRGDIKLDTGDESKCLGSGCKDFSLYLIKSFKLKSIQFNSNLSYTFSGGSNTDYWQFSLLGGYSLLKDKLNIASEIIINNSDNPKPVLLGLGINYELKEGLNIDTGITFGLTDSTDSNNITMGLTKAF